MRKILNKNLNIQVKVRKNHQPVNIGLVVLVILASVITWFLTEYIVYKFNNMDLAVMEQVNESRPSTRAATTIFPVTVSGNRFYSGGVPYYSSAHFLISPFTHSYFSPVLTDVERAGLIQTVKDGGYNSIYLYTLNQGDYSSQWVTPYVDSGSFVMGGSFDDAKIAWWKSEMESMIQDEIRPIIWLRADDSPAIVYGTEFKRYIDKMVASFDDLPIMWVLGLEFDEYWSKTIADDLGSYLKSKTSNPVGIHQLPGNIDYMNLSWVDYGVYQFLWYGADRTWVQIYSETLLMNQLGKPFIASEYYRAEGFTAKQLGLAAAFANAAGTGNGAPSGLDEFMSTLPDNMMSSRDGNILTLTGGGVTATANMLTLEFSKVGGTSVSVDADGHDTCAPGDSGDDGKAKD